MTETPDEAAQAQEAARFPPDACICRPPSHSGHYSYCPLNAFGLETPQTWYILACRQCGNPGRPLPVPFTSPAERGRWAAGHTRATGHDQWIVIDHAAP